jgi:citrate synthase
MSDEWLSASDAARRLGVKPETLYAYVSRGLLVSRPEGGGGRARLYNRADVERLAQRARRGGRAGAMEVLIESGLTLVDPGGRVYYRGRDATELAWTWSYERVAEWLWTGSDAGEPPEWLASPSAVAVAGACVSGLGSAARLVDNMRVSCAAVATTDPLRHDRRPEAVASVGRSLVAALIEVLPQLEVLPRRRRDGVRRTALQLGGGDARTASVAAGLWPRLSGRQPRREELSLLNAALVLLADHDLAASTLAARLAASTWTDPYLVVQTGLAVLSGPLHGGHSEEARALLASVVEGVPAAEAVGSLLRSGAAVPGLGHAVYRGADPRAQALLPAIEGASGSSPAWVSIRDVLAIAAERQLPFPNVDFAVAALCICLDLAPGAGEAIFAVARCAGWLAHAIEEYQYRLRFRPRTVYVGPAPVGSPQSVSE